MNSLKSELCFIRIGDIPPTGKSRIHRGDAIIGEEKGVSVWECLYRDGKHRIILPNPINENAWNDLEGDMLYPSNYKPYPVYRVEGDVIGYGSDNEPLLSNIRNVIKIADKIQDIFENSDQLVCGNMEVMCEEVEGGAE